MNRSQTEINRAYWRYRLRSEYLPWTVVGIVAAALLLWSIFYAPSLLASRTPAGQPRTVVARVETVYPIFPSYQNPGPVRFTIYVRVRGKLTRFNSVKNYNKGQVLRVGYRVNAAGDAVIESLRPMRDATEPAR